MKLSWLIFSFCLLAAIQLHAQGVDLRFEKYTPANGLPDNNTNALLQDSRGFLWVGTRSGLARYDGHTFKQYNLLGKEGLTDLSTTCLAEDKEGNIWIGTGNGLNKLDPFTESITHYYEGSGPGTIPYKWCNYLYLDKTKTLWLTTEKGIARYNEKTNSFENFPVTVYGADAKINKFICRAVEDSRDRFWLTTSYGIKLFDRGSKTYESFTFKEPAAHPTGENATITLFEDHSGRIWVGSWGGGLLKYDPGKNSFEKVRVENPPSKTFVITEISEIRTNGNILLCIIANGKFYFLRESNGKNFLEPVQLHPLDKDRSFSAETNFSNILTDKQGNAWMNSNGGLYKMKLNEVAFQWIPLNGKGSNGSFIYHIIPDIKYPQTIFYLTSMDGWWKYNAATRQVTTQALPSNQPKLLKYINAWCTDDHGYWFTSVEGFGYYDIYSAQLTDLSNLIRERSGQFNTGYIARDGTGKIWVAMRRSGILVYDPLTKKSDVLLADSSRAGNIFGKTVTDIKYSGDNIIYCCVAGGLYKINTLDHSYTIIRPPAYEEQIDETKIAPDKILVTKDNRILVSSYLRVYELKNDRLSTVYPAAGLSQLTIEKIMEDPAGFIWIVSPKGIYKTDAAFQKWINISSRTDREYENFSEINTSRPGEVLFNGAGQVGVLKDSLLQKTSLPPGVIISSVGFGEKQVYLASLKPAIIRSSYKDAIDIELSAIDFRNEKENRILYQLTGWDKNWKELSGSSRIRYEQLPPGDYTFKTKTVNTEGGESPESLLNFTVVPPFYRTWWFIIIAILLTAAILFSLYRYRLQKALEMERLRIRIATDLHDDIGATLSSISMYSQAVKSQLKENNPHLEKVLDKMGENSRKMVTSMSDIVWAINPENDDGEKLIQRMEAYAKDICAVKGVQLDFWSDTRTKLLRFPLEHRKNIYLIFKESLNNALKYSLAKNIRVAVNTHGNEIVLSIQDDGKGFDPERVKKGNGLKNLSARTKEINGDLQVIAAENKGTTIKLTCTI